ncbi:MAG: septation protein IspZ [Woeseiaceae bacterium]|jgi:intracellular septation protein|nr:septation protein IspZ [Woeseiaceae bacterium]
MILLFEFLPLILFLGALFWKGIYPAVIVLMIAMPIGLIVKYLTTKALDKMYFWSTILLLIAGALTLYFRNPLILMWKPTIFYWIVAAAFLSSQLISNKPLIQRFLGLVDEVNFNKITPNQWRNINIIWVGFFIFAGLLNIYVAYNYEFETWAMFKTFGLMALTFIFMLGQTLWVINLVNENEEVKGTKENK